jgi:hypothetical protein
MSWILSSERMFIVDDAKMQTAGCGLPGKLTDWGWELMDAGWELMDGLIAHYDYDNFRGCASAIFGPSSSCVIESSK